MCHNIIAFGAYSKKRRQAPFFCLIRPYNGKLIDKGDLLKITLKMVVLFCLGLSVAVIIYPTLHDAGHSLMAMAVGAEVISFELFPLPNVMSNISGVSSIGLALIGIGGMLIPMTVSLVLHPKNFLLWYCNTLIRGISILALGITLVATIMFATGNPIANEDITSVLNIYSDATVWVLLLTIPFIAFICMKIVRDNPIKRVEEYFEI